MPVPSSLVICAGLFYSKSWEFSSSPEDDWKVGGELLNFFPFSSFHVVSLSLSSLLKLAAAPCLIN